LTYIERKAYREVPYPLGTAEWESFKNYAVAYYKEAIGIASYLSSKHQGSTEVFRSILNATLSPLVFLWEKWQLMTSEARLPYATPEYTAELEERIKRAKETTEKAKNMGLGKTDTC